MTVLFLTLATALATGIHSEIVPCPMGNGNVKRFHKVSSNTLGGYDSDLATYSTGGQFRTHAISTCPENFFSALGSQLNRPVAPDQAAAVQAAIQAAREEWRDRDRPTVWERYDTAARIALALNKNPLDIANLYLTAAWTVRDEAVGVYVGGLTGPEAAKQIIEVGSKEFKKDLTPEAIKMLHYNLARVAHRGGFVAHREKHIAAFLALSSPTPEERKAGERLQQLTVHVETRYQERAMSLLQAAIQAPTDPSRTPRATYQLADTLRRLARPTEAKEHFTAVAKDAKAPEQLRELSRFLLREISQ